jgi:hypothetical protein
MPWHATEARSSVPIVFRRSLNRKPDSSQLGSSSAQCRSPSDLCDSCVSPSVLALSAYYTVPLPLPTSLRIIPFRPHLFPSFHTCCAAHTVRVIAYAPAIRTSLIPTHLYGSSCFFLTRLEGHARPVKRLPSPEIRRTRTARWTSNPDLARSFARCRNWVETRRRWVHWEGDEREEWTGYPVRRFVCTANAGRPSVPAGEKVRNLHPFFLPRRLSPLYSPPAAFAGCFPCSPP